MTEMPGEEIPDQTAQLNIWLAQRVGQRTAPGWIDLPSLPVIKWIDGERAPPEPLLALMASKKQSDALIWRSIIPRLDRVSFSCFVWTIFDAWQSQTKPPKGSRWVVDALARFGDESAMVRLAQHVRIWKRTRGHSRIRAAIEIFAFHATAMAISQLDWLAGEGPTAAIRRLAADKLDEAAEAKGLSVDDLVDAAPTLGLSPEGDWTREAKGQSFTLRLEPDLTVSVRDSSGKVRKSMPKTTSGPCDLAVPVLRKQVQELAAHHSARLERAMITQRTWTAHRWGELFLRHPLLRLLAQRIIWASLTLPAQETTFRVAEDFTLADEFDSLFVLPSGAAIRVAHPLFWSESTRQRWRQIFEDYNLAAPFEQAKRAFFVPSPSELQYSELVRHEGGRVGSRALLRRLRRSGWRPGPAVMGPLTFILYRHFEDSGIMAGLHHDGIPLARGAREYQVRLGPIAFARMSQDDQVSGHGINPQDRLSIGSVPSIPFSETVRDLELLFRSHG